MTVHITYFVHGTTVDNENKVGTGWNQGELSELGIQQAKDLKPLVADKTFDTVFCSDLKRAVDTATIVFGDKYEITPDARLRECNYGDLNGATEEMLGEKTAHISDPFPNGESYQDAEKRIVDFLEFLKKEYDGKHVAIVAHQAPQLALNVILKNMTWEEAFANDWRKTKSWQPGWEYTAS